METGLAYYKFSLVFSSNTCIAVFELEAKTISWKSPWLFPPASDNAASDNASDNAKCLLHLQLRFRVEKK